MRTFSRFQATVTLLIVLTVAAVLFSYPGLAVHASSASLTLSPAVGPPTTSVNVKGIGFGITETVVITFDTISVGTAQTSSTGTFSKTIKIPSAAQPGNHTVQAKGQTSGLAAQ